MITSAKKTFFLFSLALMPLVAVDAAQPTLHRSPCITPDAKQPRRRSARIAALRQDPAGHVSAPLVSAQPVIVAKASGQPANHVHFNLPPEDDHNAHLSAMEKQVDLTGLQMVIDDKNHGNFLAGLSIIVESIHAEACNQAGTTRAGAASTFNADKAVYALLQQREDCVNAVLNEETGMTSLMRAAASLSPAIVQALLDAGADPLARDKDGFSAVDYARKHTDTFPKGRSNIVGIINKSLKAKGHRDSDYFDEDPDDGPLAPATRSEEQPTQAAKQPSLLRRLCCCCSRRR